jgi:ribose transport system permease protein
MDLARYLSLTEVNRLILLLCTALVINLVNPFFLSADNIGLIFVWGSFYSIMVIGEMLYLLVGAVDLSAGGVICLSNVLAAVLILWYKLEVWQAVLAVLIIGFAIGLATGFFGVFFSPPFKFILPTFIFTLMSSFVLVGAMRVLTRAFPVYGLPDSYSAIAHSMLGPVPIAAVYMLTILVILTYVAYYRPLGRHIYATGLNDDVARRVGVNVVRTRLIALSVGSALQAFAGILIGSYLAEGSVLIGPDYLLSVLAGAFIGGVSLAGGEGTPFGAILGGFIVYLIENIIVTLAISPYLYEVVMGLSLLFFVMFDFIQKRRGVGR